MLAAILLTLLVSLVKPVNAQEITPASFLFDQYKKDYYFQLDTFQKSYVNYVEKKDVDEQYGTSTTKNDEFVALKDTLTKRNKMLKAYLIALRVRLDEDKSIDVENTSAIQNNLSQVEDWLEQQNQTVNSLTSDQDLKNWINSFVDKYPEIQKIIYTALVQEGINHDRQTLKESTNLISEIQSSIKIKDQDKYLLEEIKNQSSSSETSLKNAFDLTRKDQTFPKRFNNFYPDAKNELDASRKNLIDINSNLKLIIKRANE